MASVLPWAYFGDKLITIDKATLSIAGSAVLYGLSVYTVFIVVKNDSDYQAFRLPDHYQRLVNSAKILGLNDLEANLNFAKFKSLVAELISRNRPESDTFVRASIHVDEILPGPRTRGLTTKLSLFAYPASKVLPSEGARLKTSVWRRIPDDSIPARAKINGAYVNSALGKQDALDAGYDDCLFLDKQGHICELSTANIFFARQGKLLTPGVEADLLEGITRQTIASLASGLGIETVERPIDLSEAFVADEAFACGTSAYITPIIEIDGRQIGTGKAGDITSKIGDAYRSALKGCSRSDWLTAI